MGSGPGRLGEGAGGPPYRIRVATSKRPGISPGPRFLLAAGRIAPAAAARPAAQAAGRLGLAAYIIPPMSGMPPPPPAVSFSGTSATIASVVRMFLAIDAAFWSAERVTIAGSMMPSLTRSTI
jgi:hypothetical protein